MLLPYPSWLTLLDRAAIDEAMVLRSSAVAVDTVPRVLEVVVRVVTARRPRPSAARQRALDQLHDAVVLWAAQHLVTGDHTLETFRAAIEARLAGCPWWTACREEPVPAAAVIDRPVPASRELPDVVDIKVAAKKLHLSVRTLERMAARGEIAILRVSGSRRVSTIELGRLLQQSKYRYPNRTR